MKKGIKITLISVGSLIGLAVLLAGALAIYAACSPQPAVWLLRNAFGGEAQPVNVENYEEIRANVTVHKDLVYPSADGKNRYDVYLPKDVSRPLPTVVWVHGGAFVAGSKDGIENYAVMLANEGYAVVGVDYEWAPEIRYPGQVRQVEECLRELKKVQDSYYLDLERIVLAGDSAGAHIAAQAALLATNPAYAGAIGVPSEITAEQLRAVLLYCGPYDVSAMLNTGNGLMDFFASRIGWAMFGDKHWQDGEMIKTTTIRDYVTRDFPAAFISDGNTGSFESQGRGLAEALKAQNVRTETLFFDPEEFGEVGHEYQFGIGDGGAGTLCYENTLTFLDGIFPAE